MTFKPLNLLLFLFHISVCFTHLNAQNGVKKSEISKAEKIYLQLSSTMFTSDEVIWFKAIVTSSEVHTPSQLSEILHVELIDFNEEVIDKKLLKLENGLADSFFQLDESMPPGRYLIRAYTLWNTNFNTDFISEHYIDIYTPKYNAETNEAIRDITLTEISPNQFEISANVFPKALDNKFRGKLMLYLDMDTKLDSIEIKKHNKGVYTFKYMLPEATTKAKLRLDTKRFKHFATSYGKTIVIDDSHLDVQFFPEGGTLVNDLISAVGFKAVGYTNKGIKVDGHVEDEKANIICHFKSNDLGMGLFHLKPEVNKTYFGIVRDNNGIKHKYQLPKVASSGIVLSVKPSKDFIRIKANTTDEVQYQTPILKVQFNGITYYTEQLKFQEGVLNAYLDKKTLPEGIIKLTLFNQDNYPLCERLVFNYKISDRAIIKAKTNLSTYSQRDKILVDITVKDENKTPLATNLSVLVLNKSQLGDMHKVRAHILSYFLLNSELCGTIEKPASYFDVNNVNMQRNMEFLLLTQGWRNYKYNTKDSLVKIKIAPEKMLTISGTVGEFLNTKKKPNYPVELVLMTLGKPKTFHIQEVQPNGRFNFDLQNQYSDELNIVIQSRNARTKEVEDFTINLDKTSTPDIQFKKQEHFKSIDILNSYVEKSIERKQKEEAFALSDNTIQLDEVKLSGYKLTPEREKMMDLHGPPDVVIEDKELHEKVEKWSYGLFSVLLFNYPEDINIRRVGRNGGFLIAEVYGADFTCVLIDGIPVNIRDYPLIGNLPTKEIKSVEIIKRPKNPKKYSTEIFGEPDALFGAFTISFINIYTYSKNGLYGVQSTSNLFKGTVSTFAPKREFYAPKYEDILAEDWKIPDLRSTVYWQPNLQTDSNGKAKVEFYNADDTGDMLVIVEGITKNGKLGYFETTYQVEEKTER